MLINHRCLKREKRLKGLICNMIKMITKCFRMGFSNERDFGDRIKELLLRVRASRRFSSEKIWLKVRRNGKKVTQKLEKQSPWKKNVIANGQKNRSSWIVPGRRKVSHMSN